MYTGKKGTKKKKKKKGTLFPETMMYLKESTAFHFKAFALDLEGTQRTGGTVGGKK